MDIFKYAKPIFLKDKSFEMNFQAGFVCNFNAEFNKLYKLSITASTLFRVYLNGKMVHYGPARGPHGYLRCDLIKLDVKQGENTLAIEVAGYNCPSFYTLEIPSFVQAEIFEDGDCKYYTGRDFKGIALNSLREQFVPRYSYQRAFTEVWYMDSPKANWKNGAFEGEELYEVALGLEYIERGFEVPNFKITLPAAFERSGTYIKKNAADRKLARYFIPSRDVKCFEYSECPNDVIGATHAEFITDASIDKTLTSGNFAEYKFPHINTGFIRTKLCASEPSVIYIVFSEYRHGADIAYGNGQSSILNIIKYRLPAGCHELESFECYSLMYVGILVESGCVSDCEITLREYSYPVKPLSVKTGDDTLDKILFACYQAFRQNTIDCYMDCPGRERGGWLCDSYFTGKASYLFTGSIECERLFLDNFRLAKFPNSPSGSLPKGLLPMCYPGDNLWTNSIPQWTLWYVMELGDFRKRGGDTAPFVELLESILDFFKVHENSDGLLEKLPYWNFVEWTKANKWVQDVNYPTNMLYCAVLRVAADILGKPELNDKADKIREQIICQSFDGEFFRDHAVRNEDGKLEVKSDKSAICQHEAILFDIIDIDAPEYSTLKNAIIHNFGVWGDMSVLPPDFEPLDLFIGFAVRVEVLMKLGLYNQNLEEIKALYGNMAVKTGTLWEHRAGYESQNHGFGSFLAYEILECLRQLRK
jgi:alpha-L-rhamnosidase